MVKKMAQPLVAITFLCVAIPLLYTLSKQNYLLFHTGVEYTGSMIAAAFFIVIYISQKTFGSNKMVFLSIAYLAAGVIDIFHAMAFKGMGVFPQFEGVNFAAQFWVTARMTEALGLLIFAYTLPRVFSIAENKRILFLWIFFIILSIVVIYTGHFPTCFVIGKGLTAFKIGAEYVIITVLVLAALLIYRKRDLFDNYPMIMGSIIMTIISELCFTLYSGPYDGFNFMGHIFKALSFFMMFIAFIKSGLENPLKELRQNEQEQNRILNEKNLLIESLLNAQTDLIVLIQRDGTILELNKSSLASWKMSRSEIIGTNLFDYLLPEVKDVRREQLEVAIQTRESVQYLDSRNGHEYSVIMYPILDNPENCRVAIVAKDITEEFHREKELQLMKFVVENAPVGIHITQQDGSIVHANQSFAGMHGYTIEEANRLFAWDVNYGTFSKESWNEMRKETEKSNSRVFEAIDRKKDGSLINVSVSVSHFLFENVLQSCTFISDITSRLELETALIESIDSERERMSSELHDTICQELKSLELQTALISRKASRGELDLGEEIAEIPKKTNEILNKLYRVIKGMNSETITHTTFAETLNQMVQELQKQFSGSILFRMDIAESALKAREIYNIFCVVRESIRNAIQHSGSSEITVRVVSHGDCFSLLVKDNGTGIATDSGVGFHTMRIRMNELNAQFQTKTGSSGTEIVAFRESGTDA